MVQIAPEAAPELPKIRLFFKEFQILKIILDEAHGAACLNGFQWIN